MNPETNIYDDATKAMDGTLATENVTVQIPAQNGAASSAQVANAGQAEDPHAYLDAHASAAKGPAETRISIILPTTAYFMSGVRDFTMTIVQNMTGFPEKWAYRFQSIVDELCNNAIEHGSAPGKEVKVTFVSRAGESIFVSVEDSGSGPSQVKAEEMYNIVKQHQEQLASNTYKGIRGRGLAQIVSQWTDELKFDNIEGGGLKVSVLKKLDASELADSHPENTLKIQ